jgi:hypothetical protein
MRRVFGFAIGLTLAASAAAPAFAQEAPPIVINADGPNVSDSGAGSSSTVSRPPSSSNDGGTVTLGDIDPGAGNVVIQAEPGPTTTNGRPSSGGSPAPSAPPPSLPLAGDRDADNYPDADEAAAGLDASVADTDGDGIADGDEAFGYNEQGYVTDPTAFDTDGDGLGDGEELFWTDTDPTVPNATSAQTAGDRPAPLVEADASASCADYADWLAAQTAFEAAPSSLAALDPDGDGIACESMMES